MMVTSPIAHDPTVGSEKPKRDTASQLQLLTTESQNEASQGLDTKSALEIARIINHEDSKVAAAVKKALPEIAQVIDQVARSLMGWWPPNLRWCWFKRAHRGARLLGMPTNLFHRSRPGAIHYGGWAKGFSVCCRGQRRLWRSLASVTSPAVAQLVKTWSSVCLPLDGLRMSWPP